MSRSRNPNPDPANVRRGRNNKSRAKGYERDVARIVGGIRYPADTGGTAKDVESADLVLGVRSNAVPLNKRIVESLDAARVDAALSHKLGGCVYVDRSGTRLRRFIVFDLDDYAEWCGYGGDVPLAEEDEAA